MDPAARQAVRLPGCARRGHRGPLLTGIPFNDGLYRQPANIVLRTPVLCRRHQLLLAPLDAEAGRAFHALRRIEAGTDPQDAVPGGDAELVDGPRLEAWLLKTHFGLLAAHQAGTGAAAVGRGRGRDRAARRAVRRRPMAARLGLWITPPGTATWAVAELPGFPLQLLLGAPDQPDAVYRPGGLIVRDEHADSHRMLALGWPDRTDGPPVVSLRLPEQTQQQ